MEKIKEFFFTGFYSGYIPVAPGTMGTIVALSIYIVEYIVFGEICWLVNCIVVLVMVYPAILLGDAGARFFNDKDPASVVLDEMMGYWITVAIFPFSYRLAFLGFILFRFFDIFKPFPIKNFEKFKGGLGIMADDFMAGIYAWLILAILFLQYHYTGVKIL